MSNATELLRRTIDDLELQVGRAIDEIRAYIAAEPEAEPYAWAWDEIMSDGLEPVADIDKPVDNEHRTNIRPLYTRPEPARKPMSEEEIDEELETNEYYCAKSFADGVRFAEKHHGIAE